MKIERYALAFDGSDQWNRVEFPDLKMGMIIELLEPDGSNVWIGDQCYFIVNKEPIPHVNEDGLETLKVELLPYENL